MGFVYDASGAKWEERFCLFKNLMKKYGSFDKIPCPNKLKREDFTLEELNALSRVRKWIWVSCSGQVIPVDVCEMNRRSVLHVSPTRLTITRH